MQRRTVVERIGLILATNPFHWVMAKESPSYDLIIVGSGAAALSSAIAAYDAGQKKILVLEKEPIIGGSSGMSGGAIAVAGTSLQRSKNITDSKERFFRDMMLSGKYTNDENLVRLLVNNIPIRYEWLVSRGLLPQNLMAASGMSRPRSHMFNSGLLIQLLRVELQRRNIEIKTGVRAINLLEGPAGITGVFVSRGKKFTNLLSKNGVILASGGFARNQALLSLLAPNMRAVKVVSGIGSQGDGLLMALQKGGYIVPGETIQASFGFTKNPSTIRDFTTIYYSGAIILNKEGKRFVNESLSYKTIGEVSITQANSSSFILFDENIRRLQMSRRPVDNLLWSPFDKGMRPGYAVVGKTIFEAADKAGLNPDSVNTTVLQYNSFVRNHFDPEFGRSSLTSGYGDLVPIAQSPFYIMPSIAAIMGTYCGLKVDCSCRVLKKNGLPIKGLYAAGEIMGGVHGMNYITGTGLGKALVFGEIAGRSATEFS